MAAGPDPAGHHDAFSGLDLIRIFGQDPLLKDTPIMVISGMVPPLDKGEDMRALRIADVLHKPFEIATLLEKVGRTLAARAADPARRAPAPRRPSAKRRRSHLRGGRAGRVL